MLDASQLGLKAIRAKASSDAELYGLNPVVLDYESLVALKKVEHLSLWMNPSAKEARKPFRIELEGIVGYGRARRLVSKEGITPSSLRLPERNQALTRLRERRTRLLGLAVAKRQNGHTLSILREAEKEAQTAIFPKLSRERALLKISQKLTGHGERILRPLCFWLLLLGVLVCLHIGRARFFSIALWTSGAYKERILYVLRFGFPGSSFVDVKRVVGCPCEACQRCFWVLRSTRFGRSRGGHPPNQHQRPNKCCAQRDSEGRAGFLRGKSTIPVSQQIGGSPRLRRLR